MDLTTGLPFVIALALIAVVELVLAAWLAQVARRTRELEQTMTGELGRTRDEMTQVSAQGLRIANQQRAFERQVQQLVERQGRFELRGEGRPFEQAIAMLRDGATRQELVARLGLSDSEASLLEQLHGAGRAPL